jgi:hypothetical protein
MNVSTLQPVARKIVAAVRRVLPARHTLAIGLAGTVAAVGMAIVTPAVQAQSSSTGTSTSTCRHDSHSSRRRPTGYSSGSSTKNR